MSIPLDNLYHYIESVAQEIHGDRVIIYRFYPHGSKNCADLTKLRPVDDWTQEQIFPEIYCNDQEPLDFDFYEQERKKFITSLPFGQICYDQNLTPKHDRNFRRTLSIYQSTMLLHSEKNSTNLEKYVNARFIPVYYWSHALIARDWFRYAEHVYQKKCVQHDFLIYNRAWGGTREYRLKFADMLIDKNLYSHCKMFLNDHEPDTATHYVQHEFKNTDFVPQHCLEKYFSKSNAQSTFSATFDLLDYEQTAIEVVLETLFDDQRLHLTEKCLRPIACGQPFIICATAGSLSYLKQYGFQTFDSVWDESYDSVKDPLDRLRCIVELMKQITNWDLETKKSKLKQAQLIADFNKNHFFSQKFSENIVQELKNNLMSGFEILERSFDQNYWKSLFDKILQNKEMQDYLHTLQGPHAPTYQQIYGVFEHLERSNPVRTAKKNYQVGKTIYK